MFEVSFEHAVYNRNELPWASKGKTSKYTPVYEKLEEDVGKWHVFTFADNSTAERVRNGALHFAQTQGWEVTTSVNGSRLGVFRRR